MRSYPTVALETESVILDSSRIGLYILPKYKRKTINTPALNWPRNASRAPYPSTRHVPMETMTSTMGESFAFRLRASSAVSTFSKLCDSNLDTSKSSRANALTTRTEVNTSCTAETSSLSFFRTRREAFLIRRVNEYTSVKSTGATESAISVNRQFTYSITPIMPTRVNTLTIMPRSAELMKSCTAPISLVTLLIKSPVRAWSCSANDIL